MLKNGWQRTGHHQSTNLWLFQALSCSWDYCCHEFICVAPHCNRKWTRPWMVWWYLDKVDRGSTSNMHKHAKTCWGMEIVSKVLETKNELTINEVCKSLSKANLQDGTITTLFERKGKGNVSFSMKQHTYMETRSVNIYNKWRKILTILCRVECVKWVAESMRSMKIVNDPGFHWLMKTGHPQYRIPSSQKVACDVHVIFWRVKGRIAKMLQVSVNYWKMD